MRKRPGTTCSRDAACGADSPWPGRARQLSLLAVTLLALSVSVAQDARPTTPYTGWRAYGGTPDSMQYSSLKQIDKTNVAQLELAWFLPVADRRGNFAFNPIVIDDVMYVLGREYSLVAVSAADGRRVWTHLPQGGTPQ